ncbi:acetyl/propionyl/methylcrotonyl-CoA carboxylase subunit alpha [Tengunoibacter tsumagoiensis]|uniref:Biotin-dependent 3-methylcrotonyl-coenzyme A carboxylase alpha1 subunit n=1 Tax=Tengunoibacter tsumagoiensis TaxID=2014871 RepID=A0A401ZYY6_9CHLR|nr:acetyl-CoA carboxylase biotin carboxylase subunit [Tengunoibacter tsumagoiensis]GCE12043.1 3-methylcrotonoyl-CoA carboxylase subunit alpha [Tengunoibacter tsumagoiensis]
MFRKLLIANRGEIAVRIMATCREMGIRTVAIYSEADQHARHVYEADEAYLVGSAPARESYLCGDRIIQIALESQAEALHPGYGFLSENADFADACRTAGLIFVGPTAESMRLMGSKIAAKQLAHSAGVPTVPGYVSIDSADQQSATLLAAARQLGFPLLIKASAGGGGKGMRAVHKEEEFLDQLAGAQREALAAFGESTVFLERLLIQPRHIEIQILADAYGHSIHLGERECSIQRRHQKIIEESPSPVLSPELRTEMGQAALRIVQAAGYQNAGTLEFMLDTQQHFYFLEMNTRLQVEHPVTELVTGLDLVRQQLLIAAGEPLAITQEQVSQRGHAIEVRLYAEDPLQQYLPSTGTITRFIAPSGPGIRLDSGLSEQDEITQYYDPMIAKLIVSAEDRLSAINRLQQALKRTAIFGVTTNLPLLIAISKHPAFAAGLTSTDFLTHYEVIEQLQTPLVPDQVLAAAAIYDLTWHQAANSNRYHNPWQNTGPWRLAGNTQTRTYHYQGEPQKIVLTPRIQQSGSWLVQRPDQEAEEFQVAAINAHFLLLRQGNSNASFFIQQTATETQIAFEGHLFHLQRPQPPTVEQTAYSGLAVSTQTALTAPMAGTIIKVQVQVGDIVEARQVLMILGAMKMEHAITSSHAGTVQRINYREGDVVSGGALLLEVR